MGADRRVGARMSHLGSARKNAPFQDKTIILFILTDKTKTREKFSRIYKNETIIKEILYCRALVQPYKKFGYQIR